jgi:hypothetical protein
MRRPARRIFVHRKSLVRRSDVDLQAHLASDPLPVRRLERRAGRAILDMSREASAVRYRELHGFTYGDADRVVVAEAGRGVEIFVWGVPPERRLPLRAYHSAFIVKNGIPVGYAEGLTLFERMELGYNVYHTFRDGESAWILGRLLRLLRQVVGATTFSVDPYQIGLGNDEAIESGAFWFYRKLGFRPTRPDLEALALREEARRAARRGHRSSPRVLSRLAQAPLILDGAGRPPGDWDRFAVRAVGLAVQRRMRARSGGVPERARRDAIARVSRALGVDPAAGTQRERVAFGRWALVLALVPDLGGWSAAEKRDVIRIVRAKAAPDESVFVRRLQAHTRLRRSLLVLGRSPAAQGRSATRTTK